MPALLGFVSPPCFSFHWLHCGARRDVFLYDWLERGSIKPKAKGCCLKCIPFIVAIKRLETFNTQLAVQQCISLLLQQLCSCYNVFPLQAEKRYMAFSGVSWQRRIAVNTSPVSSIRVGVKFFSKLHFYVMLRP